jgi:hypothetical protein
MKVGKSYTIKGSATAKGKSRKYETKCTSKYNLLLRGKTTAISCNPSSESPRSTSKIREHSGGGLDQVSTFATLNSKSGHYSSDKKCPNDADVRMTRSYFDTVQRMIKNPPKIKTNLGTFRDLRIIGGRVYRYMGCQHCTGSVS